MKLNRQISIQTNQDNSTLLDRALVVLYKEKYNAIIAESNVINFDNHYTGFMLRGEGFNRLKKGKFVIEDHGTFKIVVMNYLPFDLFETLFVLLFSTFIIISGVIYDGLIILISIPFIAQLIYKYFNSKIVAKQLLDEITA